MSVDTIVSTFPAVFHSGFIHVSVQKEVDTTVSTTAPYRSSRRNGKVWLMAEAKSLYEAVGRGDGLLQLARAWHERVMQDEIVSHAFSHGFHPQHTERLAAYFEEALGGPAAYSDNYGDETAVVRMHSGNGIHEEMDQRAIDCFDQALIDTGLGRDEQLRTTLHDYFASAVAGAMARYPRSPDDVPDGLQIPKWSWQGPVADK